VLWDRFPDGDRLGGAPSNVAWHLAQAGGWVQLVTRVGDDDDGRRAIDALSELIDPELVQIDPSRATGEVTVAIEHGEPRYTLHPGRAWERIECTPAVRTALATAGVFVYGTLAQRTPEGLASWREARDAAACTQVCDVNLRPTEQPHDAIVEAIRAADVLKVNDRELATIGGWFDWRDPIASLRDDRPGRLIAITHGAAGSTLYSPDGALEVKGEAASSGGDNVGCGDAYLAILVHGLGAGWDLETSARAASRYAAAVAGERGATPRFDDDRVAELLEAT
jgi:fructokinase